MLMSVTGSSCRGEERKFEGQLVTRHGPGLQRSAMQRVCCRGFMRLQVANCCYYLRITTLQNLLLCEVSRILIARRERNNFRVQHHLDIGRDAEIANEMPFGSQP